MKLTNLLLPLSLLTAQSAAAQDLSGAFELTVGANLERSENFKRVSGSFDLPFGRGFGLQADLAISKFQTADTITPSGGLHLTYAAAPGWTFGAFLTGETPGDDTILGAGLEARFEMDGLSGEAYAMNLTAANSDTSGSRYGLDMGYDLPGNPVMLFAGAHRDEFGGTERSFSSVGAKWAFSPTSSLSAFYGKTDSGDDILGLTVTLSTSDRSRFRQRDAFAALPGY